MGTESLSLRRGGREGGVGIIIIIIIIIFWIGSEVGSFLRCMFLAVECVDDVSNLRNVVRETS